MVIISEHVKAVVKTLERRVVINDSTLYKSYIFLKLTFVSVGQNDNVIIYYILGRVKLLYIYIHIVS